MSYTVNGKEYEYWSSVNQRILDKLVDREVYCCMTQEVEYILSTSWDNNDPPFTYDDVENIYSKVCEHCGCDGCIDEQEDEESGETVYVCGVCGHQYTEDEYDRLDDHPAEVYEWWAVSDWLAGKLRERGEVVIDCWCKSYWGRCCTGQSISLDGVIASIAYSMGILEGQTHDWSAA